MNNARIKQLIQAQTQALEMTAEALKTDVMTNAVTPKQTGELERSANIDVSKSRQGTVKLIYTAPYASKVYFHPEFNFRTDKNANAQGHWLDPYIDGDKKQFAPNAFRKLYKQLTRGVVR